MNRYLGSVLLASLLFAGPALGQYQLVWQDEFDGTQVDPTKWEAQIGTGCPSLCGWGNNELEYYRSENAIVSGGFLTITAKEESFGGRSYTSSRLRTKNLGDWTRGRFEMRAKMPAGQGLWPAFWMLPTDEVYGGWAASGEIDIVEYLGHQTNRVFGTLHYGAGFPGNTFTSNAHVLASGTFSDSFHEFALEWDECSMRWYVDGALYQTQTSWWSSGGPYPAPFDQRFHLLLNLAVGGNLPGNPDGTTSFPQELVVDYVRVYQKPEVDLSACTIVFDDMEHGNPFGNGWFSFGGAVGGGGINANFVDLPPLEACSASLESGWGSGGTPGFFGGFGRANPIDLTGQTHFSFWINPDAGQDYTLEINLQDDDDGDGSIPGTPDGNDDEFQFNCIVSPSGPHVVSGGGWQRISIPLTDFFDDNSFHFGGNGVFDPFPAGGGGNGELIAVVVTVIGNSGSNVNFRTDRWTFNEQTASVAGRVWDDTNGDGVENGVEGGLPGVTVDLVDAALATVVASDVTDGSGDYSFASLHGGAFEVRVDTNTLPGTAIATFDPDGIASPDLFATELACLQALAAGDFGYDPGVTDASIGVTSRVRLQNSPNPFRPATTIQFEIARAQAVELVIYDVTGRRVATLLDEMRSAGPHAVEWNGDDEYGHPVGAGIYFYALRAEQGLSVRKMVRLR